MDGKHYQVWVTIEKWDYDTKINDVETTLMGSSKSEDDARVFGDAIVSHGMVCKDTLGLIKIE